MKNEMAKAMETLKAKGINATEDQIRAAVRYGGSDKKELSEATLEQVAGGFDISSLTSILSTLKDSGMLDTIMKALGLGGDDKKDGGSGGNTNTQDNQNDHGQQVNAQGDNTSIGGMTMNSKD